MMLRACSYTVRTVVHSTRAFAEGAEPQELKLQIHTHQDLSVKEDFSPILNCVAHRFHTNNSRIIVMHKE